MKILFYCGSLEPGRDGVGDYTRRLADECAARGHECTVIALHDPHISGVTDMTPDSVRHIRLPAAEPWPERLACAIQHRQRLAPDWVSWQMVAYAFHPRGFLPAALLQQAPELRGPRCHVMLHELWLGLERGASWRDRMLGWLQRRGVLCLLDQLDPDCVQTSQSAYQHALMREGFAATVLELFGNIPIASESPESALPLAQWLPERTRADPLVAVTFGTLHPQWRPGATADWLVALGGRRGRPPVLIAIGRAGSHAPAILETFRQRGVKVVSTGELSETAVSHLLAAADLGIAAHPWALIGKSGVAAAMLEHGLPVLVPRDDWQLRGAATVSHATTDPLLARLAGLDSIRADHWLNSRRAPESGLRRTTDTFLETLEHPVPCTPLLSP